MPAATYTVNSSTSITAISPPLPVGTYDITVTTPSGTSATSGADQFTVTAASLPPCPALAPPAAAAPAAPAWPSPARTSPAQSVYFRGIPAQRSGQLLDQHHAPDPAQYAGVVDVTVQTYAGTSATAAPRSSPTPLPPRRPSPASAPAAAAPRAAPACHHRHELQRRSPGVFRRSCPPPVSPSIPRHRSP